MKTTIPRTLLLLPALLLLCVFWPAGPARAGKLFVVTGLGGGGGMYSPSISPYDSGLILLSCDMGGVYRSTDGGKNWELINMTAALGNQDSKAIPQKRLRRAHLAPRPQFTPESIYWVAQRSYICRSEDDGASWSLVSGSPWNDGGDAVITSFALLPEGGDPDGDRLLVSTPKGVWLRSGGAWKQVSPLPGGPSASHGHTFVHAQSDRELMLSRDRGHTWKRAAPLPGAIMALAVSEDGGGSLILASVKNHGIFRSTDYGASWQTSKRTYENETTLVILPGQTNTAYAQQSGSVKYQKLLRSTDGGLSWDSVFKMPPAGKSGSSGFNVSPSWLQTDLNWGYFFTSNGLSVSAQNPDFVLVSTQGELYASRDGCKSWKQTMAEKLTPDGQPGEPPRMRSTGLEVTSCWGYYFDPHDPDREYIAYTDVGFARSPDRGKSWIWSARGTPWVNTFYDLAFDPDKPGRIYAATSRRHDIPHSSDISRTYPEAQAHSGGVVVSEDWGASWKVPYTRKSLFGLPEQICTSVVIDPSSPGDARVLYAAIFGENAAAGVYISRNGGQTWAQTAGQPGSLPNRHLYRLRIHPKTGNLYCLVTGFRGTGENHFNSEGGGIWMSDNKGATWKHLSSGSQLNRWATSFAFAPGNESVIYVTASTPPGGTDAGGIYKTEDNGLTWKQVFRNQDIRILTGDYPFEHFMSIAVHPSDHNLVFAGATNNGLFASTDGGKTWRWCRSYPFTGAQSINFDPKDDDRMVLTTFGAGVWSTSVNELLDSLDED